MGWTQTAWGPISGYYGSPLPRIKLPDGRTLEDPHPEWTDHRNHWRWLLDSHEGGRAYRNAEYGIDAAGLPVRNLIRHKREYPSPYERTRYEARYAGSDQAVQATDDDYSLRLARTPVPAFMAEVVDAHLGKIYRKEINREGSAAFTDWWADVDGKGTPCDDWMAETIAPLLLVLGQIDILVDHPAKPEGEEVISRADELRLNLGAAKASYILPENMIWWKLDRWDRYAECLVRECMDEGDRWRFWDAKGWVLYNDKGKETGRGDHPFGRVPILRVFDRKRPRCCNVGLPRYERIAEFQREYYNKDSELILDDTTHVHPLLQGPEEYAQPDGELAIGPNWLLIKKRHDSGTSVSYEGFDVIDFPHGGADSLRANKNDLRDAVDRAALLMKPAGTQGTDANTVSQSGISKRLDQDAGNDLLAKISTMLARAEMQILGLVALVQGDGKADLKAIEESRIAYPTEFDLMSADELIKNFGDYQLVLNGSGRTPEFEADVLKRLVRLMLPGKDDDEYQEYDDEIDSIMPARTVAIEADDAIGMAAQATMAGLEPPAMTGMQAAAPPADGGGGY